MMNDCKYYCREVGCYDGICLNGECPTCADYCMDGECEYYETVTDCNGTEETK